MNKEAKEARDYIKKVLQAYPDICKKPPDQRTRNERRRFEAVTAFLEQVNQLPDAKEKRQLIDLIYFKQLHTLYGAAGKLYISERTAVRWNHEILCMAFESMNLM